MTITHLDLGGTNFTPKRGTVSISLDGSHVNDDYDEKTKTWKIPKGVTVIVGDFTRMPFRSNTFKDAYGGCFLEGSDGEQGEGLLGIGWKELARVMKPGCTIELCSCGEYNLTGQYHDDPKEAAKVEPGMFKEIWSFGAGAARAGLRLVSVRVRGNTSIQLVDGEIDCTIDMPIFKLTKEV